MLTILKKYNLTLVLFPILLFLLGVITIHSITPERTNNQLLFFSIGAAIYIILASIDYTVLKYYWWVPYISVVGLLILTFIIGKAVGGSVRWITIGPMALQASEFAKVALVISTSAIISKVAKKAQVTIKNAVYTIVISMPMVVLIITQPDLGTTLALIFILVGLLYFAGLNRKIFILGSLLIILAANPLWNSLHDYQKNRILVFLNPQLDTKGAGYNVVQSIIAVGSGGLSGQGFGRGTQSHLQFLPAYWTDFIFASYAEEWGFIGVVLLILLCIGLHFSLLFMAANIKDTFGVLLIIGAFLMFFIQFVINVGMNIGLMPVTGIPLPFVSYGGSSLIASCMLLGIAQSVWVYRNV
ncbi:MAG: rod shape-determining protein RodA [Patescibacteria group bacterium]|uniref:Rod shape-determining protein RodA n=1 Tax=candidate division WWE3 bacterium TaxID=2053526 RepID=A0A955EDD6_UNCKA|nr:rod shape-determining protein RodA [candidate division WWE3 bacterium]